MLIGLGKMIKKVAEVVSNLLTTRLLGYTNVQIPGGSGYYTTTTTVGNNKYISLAKNGTSSYMLFNSGITGPYEFRTFPRAGAWNLVASSGTKTIVFETGGSGAVLVSEDLITWTETTISVGDADFKAAEYKDGVFTLLSSSAVYVSLDGVAWEMALQGTYAAPVYAYRISYANGYTFIGQGAFEEQEVIAAGRNGIYPGWRNRATGYSNVPGRTVSYINNRYVTNKGYWLDDPQINPIGSSETVPEWTSPNSSWSDVFVGLSYIGAGMDYAFGSIFVTVNIQSGYLKGLIKTTDGINWTVVIPVGLDYDSGLVGPGDGDLFFDGERLVYVSGSSFSRISSSADGINWPWTPVPDYSGYCKAGSLAKVYSLSTVEVQTAIGDQGTTGAEILAPVDVYTVPVLTETAISSVKLKNQSLNQMTYDLGVLNSGVSLTDLNALINDKAVGAGVTDTVSTISQTLTEGQKITVLPSAVDVLKVDVYGTETKLPVFIAGTPSSGKSNRYSTDGLTWKTGTGLGAINIVYANNIFVGGSFSGQVWSEDAINWTLSPTSFGHTMCMYGEKFLSWNSTGGYTGLMYSTNGKTWTKVDNGLDYKSIMYINGKYFASLSSYTGGDFATSTDGISWTTFTLDKNLGIYQPYFGTPRKNFAYGNGKYVIAGNMSYSYSSDAVNWTSLDMWFLQPGQSIVGIEFFNNKFYVGGPGIYAQSDDGVTWTVIDTENSIIDDIVGNKMFVSKTYNLKYTTDGTNFTGISVPGVAYTGSPYGIKYNNGLYVVLSQYNNAYVSSDLSTWTLSTLQGDSVSYMSLANRP